MQKLTWIFTCALGLGVSPTALAAPVSDYIPGGYTYLYVAGGLLVLLIVLLVVRSRMRMNGKRK